MNYNRMIISTMAVLTLLSSCNGGQSKGNDSALNLVVGTYGHNLYELSFNPDGSFGPMKAIPAENPSFVIKDGDQLYYAVSENDPYSGVYSFRDSRMTAFQDNADFCPCHLLLLDGTIYTADYGRGSISAFPVLDGVVQAKSAVIQFNGSGPDQVRQTHSYIHQLRVIPEEIKEQLSLKGEWVLASDLGDDSIHVLSKDGADATLEDCPELIITLEDGTGPRHMEFDSRRNMLYCISELGGMVYSIAVASDNGRPCFTLVQSLKADLVDAGGSADIHLHPSGKFLYTSHRLENDGIAVFKVLNDGTLERASYRNTGIHPRNFQITPDGQFLLVACRDSRCIQAFRIDQEDGSLSESPVSTLNFESDQPVCIAF
ncbi:MAG: lactonase family protein [Rikenellaceae bacterium]|nr:lactonase family protein [Rikenellaceae bacterium]